ncbi:uteroglobin [Phocoena phocoena]|uniref:uteroglobin n=1 Tax=Phocoena phocoena TaxID=9742 RepID=UPI003307A65E
MKLALAALTRAWIHTLSLFCAPAFTEVCLNFLHVIENLFMGTLPSYEAALEPFSPEEDMKNAGAQLKMLVDTLPQKAQDGMITLTVHGSLHSHCPAEDFHIPQLQCQLPLGTLF